MSWKVVFDELCGCSEKAECKVVCDSGCSEGNSFSFWTAILNGKGYMNGNCPPQRWSNLNDQIRYKPNDILIVTYPRCGTTWTEQCVLLAFTGGDPSQLNPVSKNSYEAQLRNVGKIWPEAAIDQNESVAMKMGSNKEFSPLTIDEFDAAPSPRVLKTHANVDLLLGCGNKLLNPSSDPLALLPQGVKVIIVSRNPLDACASSFHHAWNPAKSGWPFAAWAAVFSQSTALNGGWYSWVKEWNAAHKKHPETSLWIQYEDLQHKPRDTISSIVRFIGREPAEVLIDRILQHSSIDSMKAQADAHGGDVLKHLRKGVVGDWRTHFDEPLARQFMEQYAWEMVGTGLVYDIGEGQKLYPRDVRCVEKQSVANWVIQLSPSLIPDHKEVKVTRRSSPAESYSFTTGFVGGIGYIRSCWTARWEELNAKMTYRPSDIIVATYPKCGTTWIEQCLLLAIADGDPSKLNPATKNTYDPYNPSKIGKMWAEAAMEQTPETIERLKNKECGPISYEQYEAMPAPRIIKTHAPIGILLGCGNTLETPHPDPMSQLPQGTKVIVVTRNPLDACVSAFYHAWNPAKSGWPFEAWASVFSNGAALHGGWYDWMNGWHRMHLAHPQNTLWLRFEDLQTQPREMVTRVMEFMGLEARSELIDKILVHSTIDSMKSQAEQNGGDVIKHLRKGEVGDWRNHFTPELAAEFRKQYAREMNGTGLSFDIGGGEKLL